MRPIQFLFDLPWWTGLPVFLAGTSLVTHWYAPGVIVTLFGAWTFSKLIPACDFKEIGHAIIGFPLFFAAMLIPARFDIDFPVLEILNSLSTTATYATRSALGLISSLLAFQSFR
jgi:hypothetical protein